MKLSGALLLVLFLVGCAQGQVLRDTIAGQGREAAATALEANEWYMCRASPVGAIRDRYMRSQDTADAYNKICESGGLVAPPEPE